MQNRDLGVVHPSSFESKSEYGLGYQSYGSGVSGVGVTTDTSSLHNRGSNTSGGLESSIRSGGMLSSIAETLVPNQNGGKPSPSYINHDGHEIKKTKSK